MNLRRYLFLIIIVLTIIASIFIRSPISIMPFVYMLMSLILSGLYLLVISKSCQVRVDSSKTSSFTRDEEECYIITIENKSLLIVPKISLDINLQDEGGNVFQSYTFDFILDSKESNEIILNMKFPHIGDYIFKISDIEIYGIFDLKSINYNPKIEEKIKIVPKEYNIEDFDIDVIEAVYPVEFIVPTKIEGEIYDDIREYVVGDPMKNIHWKLSAHANTYMTRVLKVDAISGISLFLDFDGSQVEDYFERAYINDGIIEISYAIGSYAIKNNRLVRLIYSQENNYNMKKVGDYKELKDTIYGFKGLSIDENYSIEMLMERDGLNDDNIFIFTSNIREELLSTILEMQTRGKRVILFYIKNTNYSRDKFMIDKSGIEYYKVARPEDFIKSLEGSQDNGKK